MVFFVEKRPGEAAQVRYFGTRLGFGRILGPPFDLEVKTVGFPHPWGCGGTHPFHSWPPKKWLIKMGGSKVSPRCYTKNVPFGKFPNRFCQICLLGRYIDFRMERSWNSFLPVFSSLSDLWGIGRLFRGFPSDEQWWCTAFGDHVAKTSGSHKILDYDCFLMQKVSSHTFLRTITYIPSRLALLSR